MASVVNELKKHGHYSTRTVEENNEALDLLGAGLVKTSSGGSTIVGGVSIPIFNCTATAKFKKLAKDKKI
ncbi:hypothetical protein C0560_09075 [Lelliottia sp. AC1]|uniref:hypothetical protein n=1 Tax=Lelliottia sp. AC1 TaxID=2067959 RepID=UPI00200BF0ED|nr:hypothetical protein [Lelliottia sp. AC1]UQC70936.1 hypothetical protein C0560_09075 [Lelliottia sp. AC1]